MKIKIESFVIHNEDGYVKFIQYRCLDCGNSEEITSDNGAFKLKKFNTLYVKNNKNPITYTCYGCHNETDQLIQRDKPISI